MNKNKNVKRWSLKGMSPEARKIAESNDILGILEDDLDALGLAGRKRILKSSFLGIASSILGKPVSITILGQSASGKSTSVNTLIPFFPSDWIVELSYATPASLYRQNISWKNKTIIITEKSGLSDQNAAYFYRILLSEGKAERQICDKSNGSWQALAHRIEGPISLITTTCETEIEPELATRMLQIPTDESPEHIRLILEAKAKMVSRDSSKIDTDAIYPKWVEVLTGLRKQSNKVTIPYSGTLAKLVWAESIRATRDFDKLLSLIEIHAVIHQYNRRKTKSGAIKATIKDDYRAIYNLTHEYFSINTGISEKKIVIQTVEAVDAILRENSSPSTSVNAIAKKIGRHNSVASKRVTEAVEKGYLIRNNRHISIGAPLPSQKEFLPKPEFLYNEHKRSLDR